MSNKRKRQKAKLVAFWLPKAMVDELDHRVAEEDTDRSKWIRNAMRRQFDALGITLGKNGRSVGIAALVLALLILGGAALSRGHHTPEPPALAGGVE